VVPVRAALRRINRVLEEGGEQLKRARHPEAELGRYYVVDLERGRVTRRRVSLPALAQELSVLAPYETVAPEDE
jgi:hypothetical protein